MSFERYLNRTKCTIILASSVIRPFWEGSPSCKYNLSSFVFLALFLLIIFTRNRKSSCIYVSSIVMVLHSPCLSTIYGLNQAALPSMLSFLSLVVCFCYTFPLFTLHAGFSFPGILILISVMGKARAICIKCNAAFRKTTRFFCEMIIVYRYALEATFPFSQTDKNVIVVI